MKHRIYLLAFFSVLLCLGSCKQNSKPITDRHTKDSILNSFFKMVDTLPYYDTNDVNYKFLKAYSQNDTLNQKALINYVEVKSAKPWMNNYLKPCAKNNEFDTLKADEAYRFVLESSFCEYFTIATIIQKGKSIKVNVVVYKNASLMDSIPCSIAQKNEIEIDSTSWEKFKDAMFNADFWGLKEDNGYGGVDGSSLDVLGYKKDFRGIGQKRSCISRWSRSMDNLVGPFIMLLRFCKIKKGCITPR